MKKGFVFTVETVNRLMVLCPKFQMSENILFYFFIKKKKDEENILIWVVSICGHNRIYMTNVSSLGSIKLRKMHILDFDTSKSLN